MTSPQPFRFFDVTVAESVDLTPSFRRVRLEGPDLRHFGDPGWDQRIKVVLPRDGLSYEVLPRGGDWYTSWRDLPAEQRHPLRTYTTRRVSGGQLEIDFVRHQPAIGPAAQWIENAAVGDFLVILGPNAEWDGEAGGIDFVPPARTENYLLVGDETAAPAIAVMLENLPRRHRASPCLSFHTTRMLRTCRPIPDSMFGVPLAARNHAAASWFRRAPRRHVNSLPPEPVTT